MGIWSCLQTEKIALRYAGILNLDDGGQLPAVCVEALDLQLGLYVVVKPYFIFCQCGEGADQKVNCLTLSQVLPFS